MEYAVYWLIALVVLLVIEAATLGLATIWFATSSIMQTMSFDNAEFTKSLNFIISS